MNLFRRPKQIPVEVPKIYGERPSMSDLKAALEGQHHNPAVRAVVHLLLLRRTAAAMSARAAARVDKPAAFDLGGVDYVDDVFNDVHAIVTGQPPDGALPQWFTDPE